jgi:CHAT domain-containing protein
VVSSYTPAVTALLQAQGAANRSLSCSRLSLALVAEERPQDRGLLAVPGVNEEIELVAAVAKSSSIEAIRHQTGSTTIKGISEMIQQANIVHLACHRIQDMDDAAQSGFCLGDGCLTISSRLDLKLDHSLVAFLSACETVKGDKEQPDQAMMHLPAAMLYGGFRNVIATMWYVNVFGCAIGCSQLAGRYTKMTGRRSLSGSTRSCSPKR